MSSMTWRDDRTIIQRAGNEAEELGYVELENDTGFYVLWLKDTCGVLDLSGGHIRGDTFSSMEDARQRATLAPSAFIMHYMWLRNSVSSQFMGALDNDWERIAPELGADVEKESLRSRIAEHINQLPVGTLKEWSQKIAEGLIIALISKFLGLG